MTYSSEVLADSPSAYWRLGDSSGTTMADSSGNARNGTYAGSPTLGVAGLLVGDANTCVDFDGINDTATVAYNAAWMAPASFTVEAVIQLDTVPTGTTTNASIINRWEASSGNRPWVFSVFNGTLRFLTNGGDQRGNTTLQAGVKYHVAAVYSASNVTFYLNGVSDGSFATSAPLSSTALMRIGAMNTGTVGHWFDGRLDEVAFYGSALSGTRIAAHYAAAFPATTISGGHAAEVDAGRAGSTKAGALLSGGHAAETDAGRAGSVKSGALVVGGHAAETDTPHAGTKVSGQAIPGGHASETDTPHGATLRLILGGGHVTESDAGRAGVPNVTLPGGHAAETDTPRAGVIAVVIPGGIAHETDTAHGHNAGGWLGGHVSENETAYSGAVVYSYATARKVRAGGRRRSGLSVGFWEPAIETAPTTVVLAEKHDIAQAFTVPTTPTESDLQPRYTVTTESVVAHQDRILVGGKDVTYFRGARTPTPSYQLVEPLLYGPATLSLPQVAACFETPGVGALSWLKPGATVKVQRVSEGAVVATDYVGVVVAFDVDGNNLTVQIGGEASGRAALRYWPQPLFRSVHDIGRWVFHAMHALNVRFKPYLGPDTGIELARFGGTGHLDYISQLLARAQNRDGAQWTVTKNGNYYEMVQKDRTTIHGTAYLDDSRTVGELRRDIAEEPNRIYGTGTTPEGERVVNGIYPGVQKTKPAPYPFHDGRSFGLGTQDADTDTGDGITVMIGRLRVCRYMGAMDAPGGFDRDVVRAVKALQDDAGLTESGDMNVATWNALYDLGATGMSLRWSKILPMAQKGYTREWRRAGSGAIMGRNPNYDPSRLVRDRQIDFGAGYTEKQMREWSRNEIDQSEDNWVGDITLHSGAIVSGDHTPGDPITSILRARDIKPGMNLRLPLFAGGITVHVSAADIDPDGLVKLSVDTRARDSLEVWEIIARNRETRRDPARQWERQHRASGETKDVIDGFTGAPFGFVGAKTPLHGGEWNIVEVPAGQIGTIMKLTVETNPNAEYAVAIFGAKVSAATLNHTLGNPLTAAGRTKWDNEAVRNRLDDKHLLLYAAGDKESPCGYWPHQKVLVSPLLHQKAADQKDIDDINAQAASESRGLTDAETKQVADLNDQIADLNTKIAAANAIPLTGKFQDDAQFTYATQKYPVLYVAIYPDRNTSIPAGRVFYPQLEAGA